MAEVIRRHQCPSEAISGNQTPSVAIRARVSHTIEGHSIEGLQWHSVALDVQSAMHSACTQHGTQHGTQLALSSAQHAIKGTPVHVRFTQQHSACTQHALSMQSRALRCTYALRSSAIIGPAEPRYAVGTPLTEARSLWGDEGAVVSTCMQPPSRRPRVAGHSRGTLAKVKHARAQSGVIRSSSDAIRSHQEQLTCQGKASPGAIRSHQEQLRCNQESSGAAHLPR